MTDKEIEILKQLEINPFISQQNLADKVGLSRSSTANYITKLIQRGEIQGRAYILENKQSIICIGGANVDRKAHATQSVRLHSSNPVEIEEVTGGVARNYAQRFCDLGINTTLISCVANDKEGDWLLNETKSYGIDVSKVLVFPSERTGTSTDLIDINGKKIVSMADMNIYKQMNPKIIKDIWPQIIHIKGILLDTNFPKDSVEFIINKLASKNVPLFIDPVSPAKALNVPDNLDGVLFMNLTKEETEIITSNSISSTQDYEDSCKQLNKRGVENLLITLDNNNVYYFSANESGYLSLNEVNKFDEYIFFSNIFIYLMRGSTLLNACNLEISKLQET